MEQSDGLGGWIVQSDEATSYLNDPQNPTGYSQVLVELVEDKIAGRLIKEIAYAIGHDLIAQSTRVWIDQGGGLGEWSTPELRGFLYDGHGTTRGLVDALGSPAGAGILLYDAYGLPLNFDPSAIGTHYLYSGEQWDQRVAMQYLRARFYNPAFGGFSSLDPFAGNSQNPQSYHKYAYVHGDPITGVDPSGLTTISGVNVSVATVARTMANVGAVIGAGYGAIRAAIDASLEKNATIGSVALSSLYGGTSGLIFGYFGGFAFPYIALGGPWAIASFAALTGGYGVWQTIGGVRESVDNGQYSQASFRAIAGTFEAMLSLIGGGSGLYARYGQRTAFTGNTATKGTTVSPTVLRIVQWITTAIDENVRIQFSDSIPPGAASFRPSADRVFLNPKTSLSVLIHEVMHVLHRRLVGKERFGKLPQDSLIGREQTAYEMTRYFFGRYMSNEELSIHAARLRQAKGDPRLADPR